MGEEETLKTSDHGEGCCSNIVFCNVDENCGILEWDRSQILRLEERWILLLWMNRGEILISMF